MKKNKPSNIGALLNLDELEIKQTYDINDKAWNKLRTDFAPEISTEQHRKALSNFINYSPAFTAFIATSKKCGLCGFAEVSVRNDYVNGCQARPTLYLEGIYVQPQFRSRGIARELISAASLWGLKRGCVEFASDVFYDDFESRAAHSRMGFHETEKVIFYKKSLTDDQNGS